MTLQSILQSDDFLFVSNTLIGLIFILSIFTAIQAISVFKSSGSNPMKRKESLNGLKKAAIFFFIDGILISVKVSNFFTDLIIKSTIFQSDAALATNRLFETAMFFVKIGSAFTFLSIAVALISGFVLLAISADNPKIRRDAISGLLWSIFAMALLGSITLIAFIFIKMGNLGGI